MPATMLSPIRASLADYNGGMNLKLYLLVRMTLLGLLCWLGVSAYLVGESGRRAAEDITTIANQLQPMVADDVMRRWGSLDADVRHPDLGGAAARFPEPVCLRYSARDASESQWGCGSSHSASGIPRWIVPVLDALGPGHITLRRQISAFGIQVGTLRVEPDDTSLLQHQWRSVRELMALSAVMLLTLDMLAFWVIGRALRPTAAIVAAVERLGEGMNDTRLPQLRPREFALIASGINRLAKRLADSYTARAELTARLIRVQEAERRELAHELHEEFGQCVTALSAVSASIRDSVRKGDALTEAEVMPLESGVEHMLSSLRALLQRMSLPPLEQQSLRSALADLVAAWRIRLHGGPRVVVDADASIDQMPNNENTLCVYRVVQECLSNIARHAPNCQMARVYIRQDPQWLQVRVSNDLVESGQDHTPSGTGMGLKLLGERVRSLYGAFSIEVSALQFAVEANLPVSAR
jgi:two-component system sensor histidine kinase UhpB